MIKVERASRPFRWLLAKVLRRRRCAGCGAPLEIVWLRTPQESGVFLDGDGVGWESGPTETVSVGYRCTGCRQVFSRKGAGLGPDRSARRDS